MNVILLTLFVSLMLAALFLVLFLDERRHRGFGSVERDALLPFAEERAVARPATRDHGDGCCGGCRAGDPCATCPSESSRH